jgi:transposase-like protein
MVYLWRAVDAAGEVLDVLVQSRRNKHAALKLMRKLLKKYGFAPDKLSTYDLKSYAAAANDIGIAKQQERGRWRNNRGENSHKPTRRREQRMQGCKSPGVSPRISLNSCSGLQYFQRPTPSHLSNNTPSFRRGGDERVARGSSGVKMFETQNSRGFLSTT